MNVALRPALELSVIVPTGRPLSAIAPTLDALAQQSLAADRYEVVVVLDGPDGGRAAGLSERRDPYPLSIVGGPGRGRAAACNAGLAVAGGAVVLLLDDDMAPRADALAAHLARHAGPVPQAVMGAVPVHVPFAAPFATGYIARRFARHMAKLARARVDIRARDVYTGAFSVPRYILKHLGGFDERFHEYGNEDSELAGRLFRAGVPVVFAPEAVSVQTYEKSFLALAADNITKGRTAVRFAELHAERGADAGLDRLRRGSLHRRAVRRLMAHAARDGGRRRLILAAAKRLGGALVRVNPGLADRFTGVVLEACFQVGVWEASSATPGAATRRTVVHYCDSVAAGGAERVALTILAGLDRSCWRPVLVVHDHSELRLLVDEARARGIACVVEPRRRARAGLRDVASLARTFRRLRPAAAHIHRTWAAAGTAGILAAVLARVPVRVTTEHLFLTSTPRRVLWRRRLLLDRLVHRHIAVSRAIADVLRTQLHVPQDRIVVVPNGIVPPAEPRPATVRAVRAPLAMPDGARLVVVPAQLRRQKGHDVLLDALPELPGVVAAFAGEGPEHSGLAARAEAAGTADRVRFLGYREDLPSLLAAGDIVVLPSTAEGLPLAVLEALALGRPVVASAVGGTPEAIQDGVNGLLVPPRDAKALAAAIRSLLADPVRATRLGDAGRRSVRARFTAERMVRQTAQLYEELLRTRARRHAASPAGDDDLRRADWRFLTGRGRFARLAVFAGAPAAPTPAVAAQVVVGERAAGASCDAALAHDPDAATLRVVRAALRPGGSACLQFALFGRSPARLVERVRSAGFHDPRPYAPWPSAGQPRAWLPLDDAAARSRVLSDESAPRTLRGRVGRARRRLWEARALTGTGGPVHVIAGPPVAASTEIEERVRQAWSETHGGTAPDRLSWLLLTGGGETISKVVAVALAAGTRGPGIVVKWPRTLEAGAGLAREAHTLDRLAARRAGDGLDGVPRILFRHQTAVGPALGETLLAGVPLARRLDRRSYPLLADAAVDWLVALAARAPRLPLASRQPAAGRIVADAFLEYVEPVLDPGLLRAGLALLDELAALPPITEHRDFAPWNVLVDGRASLGVVDWESAVVSGLPLVDAWYFLTHLGAAVEKRRVSALPHAYSTLIDPDRPTGRVVHDAIQRYVDALAVPASAIPALRAATWMIHVPSEMRRITVSSRAAPTPAQVRHAAFVRLWEDEVRRATGARPAGALRSP